MRKQLGMLLVFVAAMPLIVGGGGMGPPQPGARKVTGPAVTATVVIDPHMAGVTSNAKRATIRLEKGALASTASFDIPSTFVLNRGCDLHLTDLRFVYVPITRPNTLYGWVPLPLSWTRSSRRSASRPIPRTTSRSSPMSKRGLHGGPGQPRRSRWDRRLCERVTLPGRQRLY